MSHRLKCLDPFSRIRAATEAWPSLDMLLKANDLPGKSGNGMDAILFYEQCRYEELKKYCEDDVLLLTQLVLLPSLRMPNVGTLPAYMSNVLTAISASRSPTEASVSPPSKVIKTNLSPQPTQPSQPEDEFVLV